MQPVLNKPADRYRRAARRIRGRHGGKPGELYRSLRDLSDRYDSIHPVEPDRAAPIRATGPADHFTSQIVDRIRNGVLTYSDRLELLDEAGKLGIGRFDANLIIAAVQHRYDRGTVVVEHQKGRKLPALDLLAVYLVVQTSILVLVWAIFLR